MLALWVVAACLLLALMCRYMFQRPPNFPPGPPRLPVWGSYWFLHLINYRYVYKALAFLGRLYGTKLVGLHLGPYPTIAALDYKTIKELYDNPDCQGRLDGFLMRERAFGKKHGLFFTDGDQWQSQRRFMLKNMRDLGYARRSPVFEDVLSQEIRDLLDLINGDRKDEVIFADECLSLPKALCIGGGNMLCHVIFGGRYPPAEHHKLYELSDMACWVAREIDTTGNTVMITPWLRHFGSRQFGYKGFKQGTKFVTDFFKAAVEERKATINPNDENDLRFFVDFYLNKIQKNKSEGIENYFQEDELLIMCTDMMLPTMTTMTSLMTYALLQLALHPDVMTTAQEAIDFTVGRSRLPTLDDRNRLPYIEAIIREAMRLQSTVPISNLRRSTAATTVSGYSIPENTAILPVLWAADMDPEMWNKPEEFRPERFLDTDGNLVKDRTLPFGGGKRLCVGETFARHHIFLFISSLLQNYWFSAPPGVKLPDPEHDVVSGVSITPPDFRLKVTRRA